MSRTIFAGIVAGTVALGFAACGTEVEEQGSGAKPNEKAAPSESRGAGLGGDAEGDARAARGRGGAARGAEGKPTVRVRKSTDEDLIPPEVIIDYMFKSNPFKQQFCRRHEELGYRLALRSFASEIGHEPGFPVRTRSYSRKRWSRC